MFAKIKTVVIFIISVALFIAGLHFGDLRVKERIPEGFELIALGTVDSIRALTPDTIWEDSVVYRDTTIYKDRLVPIPVVKDSLNFYSDSIINDSTYLVINDWIDGTLKKRNIELQRAITLRTIREPYPVFYDKIQYIERSDSWQFYVGGSVGTLTGGDVGGIKNNWMYGVGVLTDFDERYFTINVRRIIF